MGKLVVTEFVSVDGVFEDPRWTFEFNRGDEGDRYKLDELMAADAQLLGRITYEGFAQAWPERTDDAGFAEKMNSMPKYVVSDTLAEASWANSTIISRSSGDPGKEVAALKERYDGDILVAGSGTLVRWLLAEGLVDELRLMVFPVVLGKGRLLFGGDPSPGSTRLALAGVKQVGPDGVTVMEYRRIGGF